MKNEEIKYPIYLDYCATTPVLPEVIDAMLPYFTTKFGNSSSKDHLYGLQAEKDVNEALIQITHLIHADPNDLVITSGATEAINLALRGIYSEYCNKGNHIITVKTEHKAVLDTCNYLEGIGADVTYLDVDNEGLINIEELERTIRNDTILIAVMYANNETGVIQDIASIGRLARKNNILFFCDATQAVGLLDIEVERLGIDLMCMSAHKMYGPKGIGALYIRKGIKLEPQITGGAQQNGMRSGTLNVPAIIGFAKASEINSEIKGKEYQRLKSLRDHFEEALLKTGKVKINGSIQNRLPHVCNLYFTEKEADEIILPLRDKMAVSTGSACNSKIVKPSHVLKAMSLSDNEANSSIRFSFGTQTNLDNVKICINNIESILI